MPVSGFENQAFVMVAYKWLIQISSSNCYLRNTCLKITMYDMLHFWLSYQWLATWTWTKRKEVTGREWKIEQIGSSKILFLENIDHQDPHLINYWLKSQTAKKNVWRRKSTVSKWNYRLRHKTSRFFSMMHNFPQKYTMIKSWVSFEKFRKYSWRWALRFSNLDQGKLRKLGSKMST